LVIAVIVLFLVLGALWVYVRLEKEQNLRKNDHSASVVPEQRLSKFGILTAIVFSKL
jgi:hypothetical protein